MTAKQQQKKANNLLKRLVNVFTVSGAAVSTAAVLFTFKGYHQVAWLLLGAGLIIDALDGSVVRLFGLDNTLPRYDGEKLDEFADLFTFVVGPLCVAWATGMLPFDWVGISTGMIVCAASVLQFSRTNNKTDNAFWGFPSFWNIVYFYAWALNLSSGVIVGLSLMLSVLVFAPIPFAYPSRLPALKRTTWVLGGVWLLVLSLYLIEPEMGHYWLWGSLLFPVYYLGLSIWMYDRLT